MNTRYTNLKQGQLANLLASYHATDAGVPSFVYFSHGRGGWEDLPVLLNTQLQKYWVWEDVLAHFRKPGPLRRKTDLGRFLRWAGNHVRRGNVAVNVHRGESWVTKYGRTPRFLEREILECGNSPLGAHLSLEACLDDHIIYGKGLEYATRGYTGSGLLHRLAHFPPGNPLEDLAWTILPKGPSAHQARANKHWPIVTG